MSNELGRSGKSGEWSMPEPVFRSSEGTKVGGSAAENAVTDEKESDPETIMDNETLDKATTDPQGESTIEKEAKGDKLGASMTLIGVLALLGAAILFLLIYFMFFWGQTPNPS